MKEFLSREGYPFLERNVDEDEQAYAELVAQGWRTVPVTVIDGAPVRGFDERALRRLLATAAGSSPDR